MPQPRRSFKVVCYADDITVYCSDLYYKEAVQKINGYLKDPNTFFHRKPSPSKGSAILLSTSHSDWKDLYVVLGTYRIRTINDLTLLGVKIDHSLTFKDHVKDLVKRASFKRETYKRKEMFSTFARNFEETCEFDLKIPKAQKILHTKFVKSTMRNSEPNRLRKERILLSNDSSNCPLLGDLKKKVNDDQPDACRKCHRERETVPHIVECIGGIKCKDLWRSPEESVSRLAEIWPKQRRSERLKDDPRKETWRNLQNWIHL